MWFLAILGKRFFWKDRLHDWGKYEMLKIWCIWKTEIWSEELVDGHQTVPYQLGALFWGVNCLVVFPIHFNPISFLFLIFPNFLILNISNITSDFTPVQVYRRLNLRWFSVRTAQSQYPINVYKRKLSLNGIQRDVIRYEPHTLSWRPFKFFFQKLHWFLQLRVT